MSACKYHSGPGPLTHLDSPAPISCHKHTAFENPTSDITLSPIPEMCIDFMGVRAGVGGRMWGWDVGFLCGGCDVSFLRLAFQQSNTLNLVVVGVECNQSWLCHVQEQSRFLRSDRWVVSTSSIRMGPAGLAQWMWEFCSKAFGSFFVSTDESTCQLKEIFFSSTANHLGNFVFVFMKLCYFTPFSRTFRKPPLASSPGFLAMMFCVLHNIPHLCPISRIFSILKNLKINIFLCVFEQYYLHIFLILCHL